MPFFVIIELDAYLTFIFISLITVLIIHLIDSRRPDPTLVEREESTQTGSENEDEASSSESEDEASSRDDSIEQEWDAIKTLAERDVLELVSFSLVRIPHDKERDVQFRRRIEKFRHLQDKFHHLQDSGPPEPLLWKNELGREEQFVRHLEELADVHLEEVVDYYGPPGPLLWPPDPRLALLSTDAMLVYLFLLARLYTIFGNRRRAAPGPVLNINRPPPPPLPVWTLFDRLDFRNRQQEPRRPAFDTNRYPPPVWNFYDRLDRI